MKLPHPIDDPAIRVIEKVILAIRWVTGLKHSTVVKSSMAIYCISVLIRFMVEGRSALWIPAIALLILLDQRILTLNKLEDLADTKNQPVRNPAKDMTVICVVRYSITIYNVISSFFYLVYSDYFAASMFSFFTLVEMAYSADVWPQSGKSLKQWLGELGRQPELVTE